MTERFSGIPGGEENETALERLAAKANPEEFIALEALYKGYLRGEEDAITGLPNFSAYEKEAERLDGRIEAIRYSIQTGQERRKRPPSANFALAVADMDKFKPFNDELGHPAGDILLRHVGQYMQDRLREEDRLYRSGGDEFIIVTFENVTPDETEGLRSHLQTAFRYTTHDEALLNELVHTCKEASGRPESLIRDRIEAIDLSFGICIFDPERHTNTAEMRQEADDNMYAQKTDKQER